MQADQKKNRYLPKYNQIEVPPNSQNTQAIPKKRLASTGFDFQKFSGNRSLLLTHADPDQCHTKLLPEIFLTNACCVHRRQECNPKLFGLLAARNLRLRRLKLKCVQIAFSFEAKHFFCRRMIGVNFPESNVVRAK